MKQRITITLDKETLAKVKDRLMDNSYRNQSHLVEYAITKLLDDKNE